MENAGARIEFEGSLSGSVAEACHAENLECSLVAVNTFCGSIVVNATVAVLSSPEEDVVAGDILAEAVGAGKITATVQGTEYVVTSAELGDVSAVRYTDDDDEGAAIVYIILVVIFLVCLGFFVVYQSRSAPPKNMTTKEDKLDADAVVVHHCATGEADGEGEYYKQYEFLGNESPIRGGRFMRQPDNPESDMSTFSAGTGMSGTYSAGARETDSRLVTTFF